uniref:RNA helicase n=1 Tax=Acrobeloides nanus TaxID=290746 RepID=A0A914DPI3_9BILA
MLYPKTIEDDDTAVLESTSSENEEDSLKVRKKSKKRKKTAVDNDFSENFVFNMGDVASNEPDHLDGLRRFLKKTVQSTLQDKIEQERKNQVFEKVLDDSGVPQETNGEKEEDENSDNELIQEMVEKTDRLKHKPIKGSKPKNMAKADFFDLATSNAAVSSASEMSFHDLNLSRPILKAVTEAGFIQPTPIQATCIPVALAGRDICACSATEIAISTKTEVGYQSVSFGTDTRIGYTSFSSQPKFG